MTATPPEPSTVTGAGQFPEETVKALIEKGFTPRTTDGPFGKHTGWEKPVADINYWPMVALALGFLLFVLFMVKGVPWS